jgi:hypothetical protein
MPALAIRDDIGSEELRRRARRERDGQRPADCAGQPLDGMDPASARRGSSPEDWRQDVGWIGFWRCISQ